MPICINWIRFICQVCLSRPKKNTVGSKFLGWCKVDGNSRNANKIKSEKKNSNVIFNKKIVTSILTRKKNVVQQVNRPIERQSWKLTFTIETNKNMQKIGWNIKLMEKLQLSSVVRRVIFMKKILDMMHFKQNCNKKKRPSNAKDPSTEDR